MKEHIMVKNTGDTDAYMRVAITGYWCDAEGNIVAPWNENVDYKTSDWVKKDDYYYCKSVIKPNEETPELLSKGISGATLPDGVPSGSHLDIDVIAQAVQSKPAQAAIDAWGYNPGASST